MGGAAAGLLRGARGGRSVEGLCASPSRSPRRPQALRLLGVVGSGTRIHNPWPCGVPPVSPLHGCGRSRARGPLQGWTGSKLVPQRLCPRACPLPVTVRSIRLCPAGGRPPPPSACPSPTVPMWRARHSLPSASHGRSHPQAPPAAAGTRGLSASYRRATAGPVSPPQAGTTTRTSRSASGPWAGGEPRVLTQAPWWPRGPCRCVLWSGHHPPGAARPLSPLSASPRRPPGTVSSSDPGRRQRAQAPLLPTGT